MTVELPDNSSAPNARAPTYPDQRPRPDDAQTPIPGVNKPKSRLTCAQIEAELDRQGVQPPKTEMPAPNGPSTATKEAPRQFADGGPDTGEVTMSDAECIESLMKKGHTKEAAERICGAIQATRG